MFCIALLRQLGHFAKSEFPITKTETAQEGVLFLFVNFALVVWGILTLVL